MGIVISYNLYSNCIRITVKFKLIPLFGHSRILIRGMKGAPPGR